MNPVKLHIKSKQDNLYIDKIATYRIKQLLIKNLDKGGFSHKN